MKRTLLMILNIVFINCVFWAQNYNNNQNQNTIIVNNQPVIERVKYIEKYRTIYKDRPQPKRYARTLSNPICLIGTIWVYVEDLGDFRSQSDAREIIHHLNARGAYGRNDWRIPTSAELSLMEKNADKIGLGDGIYMAESHRNGILRPVSTGFSIQEQKEAQQAEKHKRECEQKRIAEKHRMEENARNARIQAKQNILNAGQGISDGEHLIWKTSNVGANSGYEKGGIYSSYNSYGEWRLPSSKELQAFMTKATFSQRPDKGYLLKIYMYKNIVLTGGRYITNDGYFDVGTSDGLSGTKGYVRLVQNIE